MPTGQASFVDVVASARSEQSAPAAPTTPPRFPPRARRAAGPATSVRLSEQTAICTRRSLSRCLPQILLSTSPYLDPTPIDTQIPVLLASLAYSETRCARKAQRTWRTRTDGHLWRAQGFMLSEHGLLLFPSSGVLSWLHSPTTTSFEASVRNRSGPQKVVGGDKMQCMRMQCRSGREIDDSRWKHAQEGTEGIVQ